jgi:endo-1,4-beta-xylanase
MCCCRTGSGAIDRVAVLVEVEAGRMPALRRKYILKTLEISGSALVLILVTAGTGRADSLNGSALAFRSSGTASGTDVTLSSDGYVGTYVTMAAPGTVTLTVQASGVAGTSAAPNMDISVNDTDQAFSVASGFNTYSVTTTLPTGTSFVRTDFSNDVTGAGQSLTVRSLQVTGTGESILNTTADATALTAADTYAANYRQGNVTVSLPGVAPGTPVEFKMIRNAFDFEGSVSGSSTADPTAYMAVANPAVGSTPYLYQTNFNKNFNTLEPANAGKWANDEPVQGDVTLGYVNTLLNYAQAHNMDVRMHNLIWGNQQPIWVNTLLTNAQSTNPTTAAAAKAQLSAAIVNRINYYVGTSAGGPADQYSQLDGLNEALRTGPYWAIFGAAGIAQIYNEAAKAAAAAGNPALKIDTNEYNVLEFSTNPTTNAQDPYANWYRQNVEDIQNAVTGPSVSGIGVQYYADSTLSNHSAGRIMEAMENLSVTGLPISLTEFNVKNGATPATATQILTETMRMMYGSPNATTFGLWDFWTGNSTSGYDAAALYDANWNLTAVGAAYESLLSQWSTDVTPTVGANGTVNFNGTYGEYDVIVGGQTYLLTLDKGVASYSLAMPEPGSLELVVMGGVMVLRRRRVV